jgi:endonuclease/exonuclease/phosphatase family metal-dependent hydrolase
MIAARNARNIILLLSMAVALISGKAASAACGPSARLMTFNVRLDTPVDGENSWQFRRDFLAGQIAVLHPSILGLQEVRVNQKRDLEAMLPDYQFLGVGRDDGVEAGEFSNLAIDRAAYAVLSSGTFWLSATPDQPSIGWDASFRRVATWAHLRRRSDGLRILALNSHWDNNGRQARLEGARLIRRWLDAHRRKGEELVVLGDFNAEPGSPELLALAQGLADDEPLSNTSKAPSIGARGSFNNFVAQPITNLTIDHIFISRGLEALRHAVVSWTADGKVASDHFAVMADVRPKAGQCR